MQKPTNPYFLRYGQQLIVYVKQPPVRQELTKTVSETMEPSWSQRWDPKSQRQGRQLYRALARARFAATIAKEFWQLVGEDEDSITIVREDVYAVNSDTDSSSNYSTMTFDSQEVVSILICIWNSILLTEFQIEECEDFKFDARGA